MNLYTYVLNNPLIYTDPNGMCVAGRDAGCYVDSFSGLDLYLNDGIKEEVSRNSNSWWELEVVKKSCKSQTCVNNAIASQKILAKANDAWRNNACSYTDCTIGSASFILSNGKATGVNLKVIIETISEGAPGFWDGIHDWVVGEKAYAAELPPSNVSPVTNYGYIQDYYFSNDHGPAHVHVYDSKNNVVRVGQNGKPLKGEPELNREQQKLVKMYLPQIRSSVARIMRYYREFPDQRR
ncbi:hypothetical protein [Paenibacillus sp. IITD108]|uniref:hypothetical protein n=1 Tax=Paenibacillus sp. IITD108 TaxID=3116649 RepID=UPI002F40F558